MTRPGVYHFSLVMPAGPAGQLTFDMIVKKKVSNLEVSPFSIESTIALKATMRFKISQWNTCNNSIQIVFWHLVLIQYSCQHYQRTDFAKFLQAPVRAIPFKRVGGMTGKFKMYVRKGGPTHNYKIRKGGSEKTCM